MRLDIGFCTHQGRVRKSNQDSVGVFQPSGGVFRREGLPLFVVADGMGGHQGGEIASMMAVKAMGEVFAEGSRKSPPGEALRTALQAANRAVLAQSRASPELKGMGTTVVAATITEHTVCYVNVGDSRGYFIRGETCHQITEDHSLVAEQVRLGGLTKEQAANARGRNVITRSVGRGEQVEVDLFEQAWQTGDAILLCSDGLWGPISDAQLLTVLLELEAQAASEKLVQLAMIGQAPDNVSVVIVRRLS